MVQIVMKKNIVDSRMCVLLSLKAQRGLKNSKAFYWTWTKRLEIAQWMFTFLRDELTEKSKKFALNMQHRLEKILTRQIEFE